MRIPTLLALLMLTIAISLGVAIYFQKQQLDNTNRQVFKPFDIKITNISDTSASISWQTAAKALGQVKLNHTTQKDDRDVKAPTPRLTHFVTLRELAPDTSYSFQIKSNSFEYQSISLKTAPTLSSLEKDSSTLTPPILGRIVGSDLQPVEEAVIYLNLAGVSETSTTTTTAGNFILPLHKLLSQDLAKPFLLTNPQPATLTLKMGQLESKVDIKLPYSPEHQIPPLILGQNTDLQDYLSSSLTPPEELTFKNTTPSLTNPYDLNSDNKLNSIDLLILIQQFGKQPKSNNQIELFNHADLNSDKIVDLKDLDILKAHLED